MKSRWLWLVAGALVVLAAGAWLGRSPVVTTVVVQQAPLVRSLQFTGRMAAVTRVDIGSTVTGRVDQVLYREGDLVRKDQVLVQLDSAEAEAALAQARAGEQQARARWAGLRSTGRRGTLATLAQAEATLHAARVEMERTEALVAQGFLSDSRRTEARRALDVAEAQQAAAQAQRQANLDQGTDVVQAQAQLEMAQAARALAEVRLDQTRLRAPADARVLLRQVEPGQIVQPGKALLSLAQQGPIQLVAQVDERFLAQLAVGQLASVVADAFPAQPFHARVQSIAPVVDSQRGSIEVKLALEGHAPPAFLREDMTLSIEVETGRRDRARVLPGSALREGSVVWVVRNGRVTAQALRLGLRTTDAVEVLDGVGEGEAVVLGSSPPPGGRVRSRPVPLAQALAMGAADRAPDALATMSEAMGR